MIAVMLLSTAGVINFQFPINTSYADESVPATDPAATDTTATDPAATDTNVPAEPAPVIILDADLSTPDVFKTEVTVSPTSSTDGTTVVSQSIPENLVEQGVEFQLYQVDGTTSNDVTLDSSTAVQYVDTDGNNIADTIQWEAPLTSETTYVIQGVILTTAAVHLDSDRNFIENVYDQTSAQDDVWTDPIPAGDYVRVTFEQALTSTNDITIYARSAGGSVEVYEKDGTTPVVTIGPITAGTYKILLTNLSGSQDTFDLKINGNPVEFDYITDPSVNIDQCANGGLANLSIACINGNTAPKWQNGDINGQNSKYREGDAIPYRVILTSLDAGSHTLALNYDFTKAGIFAIDRLTRPGLTQQQDDCSGAFGTTNNSPTCAYFSTAPTDIAGEVASPDTDHPALASGGNLFVAPGTNLNSITDSRKMTVGLSPGETFTWGSFDPNVVQDGNATGHDSSRTMTFHFTVGSCPTTTTCNVVFSWSGHIASHHDWGDGKGAGSISGAPFHMGIVGLDGTGGSQDRSVQLKAIVLIPTISTQSSSTGQVSPGTAVHDTATLTNPDTSGQRDTPTGNVDFFLCGPTNGAVACTAGGTSATSGTVSKTSNGIGSATSGNLSPTATGTYCWRAVYSGDANFEGVTSTSTTNECFSVAKGPAVATTHLHNATHTVLANGVHVPLGSTIHDSVTVTGSSISGNATFTFYNNDACSGTPASTSAQLALISGSVDATGFAKGPLGFGSYSFKAVYNGDANNLADDSDCEPFYVDKALLTVVTHVHNATHFDKTDSTVPLGSVMHDIATVSGGVGGFPLPATSFTLTSNFIAEDGCGNGAAVTNDGTEGSDIKSTASAALGAGNYAYRAFVGSNGNYTGGYSICEPFNVDKALLTITTAVHNATHADRTNSNVFTGSVMHDTSAVSGGVGGFPLPSVSFTFTTGFTPEVGCANGTPVANNSTENSFPKSINSAALVAGSYAYRGTVGSNGNYTGGNSICEPFNVIKRASTLTTTSDHQSLQPPSVLIIDTGKVEGAGPIPTGNMTFFLCGPGQLNGITVNGCEFGGTNVGDQKLLNSTGYAKSNTIDTTSMSLGKYCFRAEYHGDNSYDPASHTNTSTECFELKSKTARTQGFWSTHLQVASSTWLSIANTTRAIDCPLIPGIQKPMGDNSNDVIEMEGGFWSKVGQKSDGSPRTTTLDKNRMALIQQLLAAELNAQAFAANDNGTIAAGKTAYCTGAGITTATSALDAFNSSGDLVPFPPSFVQGPTASQTAKNTALKSFWDILP